MRSHAARHRSTARARIAAVLDAARLDVEVDRVLDAVAAHGHVALNFHPDRIARDGRMVVEALAEDRIYRSQFESGISNGGLTAYPGGDRDRWEQRMFGGAYHETPAAHSERPKYGGLDLMRHADGPSPRFGSCHLRLRTEVLARTTFCFGDSNDAPKDLGVIDAFDCVLAGVIEAAHATGRALGRPVTLPGLVAQLVNPNESETAGRALDDYIEAQVHGPVDLAGDASAIVADPSFEGTDVGALLQLAADRHGLALTWHHGFELDPVEVPAAFRGERIPLLAARLAAAFGTPVIDAEVIGRAARSVVLEPGRWADWGEPAEALQHLKQLWHVLAAYGRPHTRNAL